MPRNMSFSMTTEAVRNRTKTVTRRLGWAFVKPGDLLWAVEKGMGLKKGERVKRIALIRVKKIYSEPLELIEHHRPEEMAREGFPGMSATEFIEMFTKVNRCDSDAFVNRIEYEYVEGGAAHPEEGAQGSSERETMKLFGFQEYQAQGRIRDALECRVCGFVVPRLQRDSYIGGNHPFHHDGCPWKT